MNYLPARLFNKGKTKLANFDRSFKVKNFIDYGQGYRGTVFLAGTSRSGTTWLSDVVNYNGQYRYMFEPFYEKENPLCKDFQEKQYISISNSETRFIEPVRKILCGSVRNHWTDRFNEAVISNKRLIKGIRSNLFLSWLHRNFPDLPIILLLRHPCAVAASKMQLSWSRSLNTYLNQKNLVQDFLAPFYEELVISEESFQSSGNYFDNLIFIWCIENYVPLIQLKTFIKNKMHIVFYENFCVEPEAEIEGLFNFLGETYDLRVLNSIKKASKLSRGDSAILTGKNLIAGWKNHLTDRQIIRSVEILRLFGLDQIYSEELMPNTEKLKMFM